MKIFNKRSLFSSAALAVFVLGISAPAFPYEYFWTAYTTGNGLPYNYVQTLSLDPGGYLWIGTKDSMNPEHGGISILDRMEELTLYDSSPGPRKNTVQAIAFEAITEDDYDNLAHGAIWIATKKGLSVLNRKGQWISFFSKNSPLPGDDILDITIDRENTKWISIEGNGVCCLDADFNWENYTTTDGLCSNTILCITADSNGNIWFGSRGHGVSCLNSNGNWLHFSSKNSGLIGDYVRGIAEEKQGKIWFVTTKGISVFNGQNWMSYGAHNSPLSRFIPSCLAIDKAQNKWIATEQGGVFKLDVFGGWTHFQTDNSGLIDNRVTAILSDNRGSIWIGTPSGLCRMSLFSKTALREPPQKGFQKPSPVGMGKGAYYPFEDSIIWNNIDQAEAPIQLSFALPSLVSSGKLWFYSAFWGDDEGDFNERNYWIIGDRLGNTTLKLEGSFSQAHFLTAGVILTTQKTNTIEKKSPYPFPQDYPEELIPYLQAGRHIPSDAPEIRRIVHAMLGESASKDMYQSVQKIVYSPLIQNLAFDRTHIGLLQKKETGEESAQINAVRDPFQLLKERKGGAHAKSRLVCTLARAAGIPARIVMSIGGKVWNQVWLSGLGWVPVEASYPVYDYVRTLRTYFPKLFYPEEHAVVAVSGTDDNVSQISWSPLIKGYFVKDDTTSLKNHTRLSTAKLIIMKTAGQINVPFNALMEVGDDTYVFALGKEGEVFLVFKDHMSRVLKEAPLAFDGLSNEIYIADRLFWRFIPRRIGEMIAIENLECRAAREVFQDFQSGSDRQAGESDY